MQPITGRACCGKCPLGFSLETWVTGSSRKRQRSQRRVLYIRLREGERYTNQRDVNEDEGGPNLE